MLSMRSFLPSGISRKSNTDRLVVFEGIFFLPRNFYIKEWGCYGQIASLRAQRCNRKYMNQTIVDILN